MAQLIGNERVDDIPLLLHQMQKVNLSGLLDEHFTGDGNWQGISIGAVVAGWLSYILSTGDHRLNQVEDWAERIQETLKLSLDPELAPLDFSDDHLGRVLDYLSEDEAWDAFEGEVTRQTIRVYDLTTNCVRIDTTTAKSYRDADGDGLFQFGHSKDYRPDLPQVKISQAALDPLGLPVSTTVVGGNCSDDRLYVPEIKKVQQSVQSTGLLYVGDCKMSALATREYIAQSGNTYLSPLSEVQVPKAELSELLAPAWRGETALTQVAAPQLPAEDCDTPGESISEGFSVLKSQSIQTEAPPIDLARTLVGGAFVQAWPTAAAGFRSTP
jgi:transposase